jgi:SAM-dependent methyltransferase
MEAPPKSSTPNLLSSSTHATTGRHRLGADTKPTDTDILDLGCGLAKHQGAYGVDNDPAVFPDLLHDLDVRPYPLPSDHFREVICQDVLEHVRDVEGFLREVHRVSRHGCKVRIRTPHFSSWYAYNDPTHIHIFGYFVLDRFTDTPGSNFRSAPLFRYARRSIVFSRLPRLVGIARLANTFPARYEQLFAFTFPAENLLLELTVLKEAND